MEHATERTILWHRLDRPGHEGAKLARTDSGWRLTGGSVFAEAGEACALSYTITCDSRWRTVSGAVAGFVGGESIAIEIRGESGHWSMNGEAQPQVARCTDLDLNFSPSTNLLPIRRLELSIGSEAAVRAAWLRFPSFRLEPLEQVYRRISERIYRYESAGGSFTAELEVDVHGFVTRYPGFFEEHRAS